MSNNDFSYVRDYYDVPAEVGRGVVVSGRSGVIAESRGNYIGVMFDDDPKCQIFNAHPTSEVEYGDMKVVRKLRLTRSQKNYREFLSADWFDGTFGEWLGAKSKS